MKKLILISIFYTFSFSYMIGGNLTFVYSSHNCGSKPYKPVKPYSFNSQWEVDNYNNEMANYYDEVKRYVDCIKEYIENAEIDKENIDEKINEAVDDANEVIREAKGY